MFQYCAQSSYQKCSKNYFNKRNSISWKYCEIVEKVQFYKTDQCICSFFFLKADIFLYFGETNTVIKLSRNPKQKYCYFKDSSSSLLLSLPPQRSPLIWHFWLDRHILGLGIFWARYLFWLKLYLLVSITIHEKLHLFLVERSAI